MLGGLLTLAALAITDAMINFKRGGLRNVAFVLIAGAACVVMSGLLSEFVNDFFPVWFVQGVKGSLGPAAGAVALYYLGIWLGGNREDRTVHAMTAWGALVLGLASAALLVVAVRSTPEEFATLLYLTFLVNFTAAVLGLGATLRAAALGDPLARWMAMACVGLVLMVVGIYLKALAVPGFGIGTWIATAIITVLYFLTCIVLVMLRNREQRELTRLASLKVGADAATGLPTGSMLLSEVEHAFWRAARLRGECTLVCLNVGNLYELSTMAGHGVEQQIQVATAARIRRAAGFRCVVGLYQPRCFVVVISADKRRELVQETVQRLRATAARRLMVTGRDQLRHEFAPQLSVGVVTLKNPGRASPLEVIHEAERRALISDSRNGAPTLPPLAVQDAIPTEPSPLA